MAVRARRLEIQIFERRAEASGPPKHMAEVSAARPRHRGEQNCAPARFGVNLPFMAAVEDRAQVGLVIVTHEACGEAMLH